MTRTSKIENRGKRIGYGLFRWAKWKKMPPLGRSLWLGLYASAEASLLPIGLWWGDLGQLARAAALTRAQVEAAIAELVDPEVDAIAYEVLDDETIVLRLTELPDRCEGAFSHTVVFGWWGRFANVPACRTRDEHLPLLRWLCDASDDDDKRAKAVAAWDESFGRYAASLVPDASSKGEGTGEGTAYPTGYPTPLPSDADLRADGEGTGYPQGEGTKRREEKGERRDLRSSSGEEIAPRTPDVARDPTTPVDGAELWAALLGRLSERVLAQQLELWVAPIEAIGLEGSTLQLRAPNAYVRSWFEAHYLADVTAELRELSGVELRVVLEVDPSARRGAAGVEDLAPRALERYGPRSSSGRGGR